MLLKQLLQVPRSIHIAAVPEKTGMAAAVISECRVDFGCAVAAASESTTDANRCCAAALGVCSDTVESESDSDAEYCGAVATTRGCCGWNCACECDCAKLLELVVCDERPEPAAEASAEVETEPLVAPVVADVSVLALRPSANAAECVCAATGGPNATACAWSLSQCCTLCGEKRRVKAQSVVTGKG
jgi:hypothetical protein